MKKLIVFLILLIVLSAPSVVKAQSNQDSALSLFTSEATAQEHCPSDTVVWLNLPTGVYHFKGQRWYGSTKSGAYVCQKDADKFGDRSTRNGQ